MPLIQANGLRHYYRIDGCDDSPALILAHSLGCDHSQWDAQAAQLQPHFRVIRYDLRGHGASEAPAGDYSIEMLARDALALADALGCCAVRILRALAGRHDRPVARGAGTGSPHARGAGQHLVPIPRSQRHGYAPPHGAGRRHGSGFGCGASQRFFTAERLAANPPAVVNIRRIVQATNPAGYAGCCAAVRDMNQTAILESIRVPTLIIVGDRDVSTPWEGHGEVLARGIPHARVQHLPTAHLSNIERPHSFTGALLRFLCAGRRVTRPRPD